MPAKDIHEAIHAVMQEVGYVQKTRGQALGYSYASESALIEALRPEMVKQGIYCYVSGIRDVVREEYTTSRGANMNSTRLVATLRFVHAASGTHIDTEAVGEGADSGDKSANKASTGAYKYCLRQTFCIETGDDPDGHASQERAPSTSARPLTSKSQGHVLPAPEKQEQPWATAPGWARDVRDQLEAWGLKIRDIPEFMATGGKSGPECLSLWRESKNVTHLEDPFGDCIAVAFKYAKEGTGIV